MTQCEQYSKVKPHKKNALFSWILLEKDIEGKSIRKLKYTIIFLRFTYLFSSYFQNSAMYPLEH